MQWHYSTGPLNATECGPEATVQTCWKRCVVSRESLETSPSLRGPAHLGMECLKILLAK